MFDQALLLNAGSQYRLIHIGTGAFPSKLLIKTTGEATLRAALIGDGGWVWTETDAASPPAWDDDLDAQADMNIWIEDMVGELTAPSKSRIIGGV